VDFQQDELRLEPPADAEARYRAALGDEAVFFRCAFDAHRTPTRLGAGIQRITGHRVDEFLSGARTLSSVVFAEDRAALVARQREAIAHAEPYELEYRMVHASGGLRTVFEAGEPVTDAEGELLYLQGALLDVTAT
jgi:PAS domain S-box-containing protein